jgi:5'(3')-deoxyribonucleotidase
MKNKAAVGADLYVEDSPSNVERLRADGHKAIVFTNSTNEELDPPRADSWRDIERLVKEAHEKWKQEHREQRLAGH